MHTKNLEKGFYFCDKGLWIVRIESFLPRTHYFSSVVNVLTKSLKTLHVTTRDFSQLIYVHNDQQIW